MNTQTKSTSKCKITTVTTYRTSPDLDRWAVSHVRTEERMIEQQNTWTHGVFVDVDEYGCHLVNSKVFLGNGTNGGVEMSSMITYPQV